MATAITMPDLGTTVEDVVLLKWLKEVGDPINRGEALCEVETDKATTDLESIAKGVLLKKVASEGDSITVGTIVAYVGELGETVPD